MKTESKTITQYLPLTESTFYIMLSLVDVLHGYGIMQRVEQISQGTVRLGAGTLYGALQTLEKDKLIIMVKEEGRRKCYVLTDRGKQVLAGQIGRLEIMRFNARGVIERLNGDPLPSGKEI